MSKNYKICILAYGDMYRVSRKVIESIQIKDYEILCVNTPTNKLREIVTDLITNGCDVFITRGSNAAEFRRHFTSPMYEIKINEIDYLLAIKKAFEIGYNPAIVSYAYSKPIELKRLSELSGHDVHRMLYEFEEDLPKSMETSAYDVFIGGSYVCEKAALINKKYVPLEINTEAIYNAINHACTMAKELRQSKFSNEINRALFNSIPFGFIICGPGGEITYSNPSIQKYTGLSPSQLHNRLAKDIFPNMKLEEFLSGDAAFSDSIRVIRNARVRCILTKLTANNSAGGALIFICSPNDLKRSPLKPKASYPNTWSDFISSDPCMKVLVERAKNYAKFDFHLTVIGKPGTGRAMFSECIHNSSMRSGAPLITLNMTEYTDTNAAQMLLGCESPLAKNASLLEEANESTVILKGLHLVPMGVQALLSGAILDNRIYPVGSNESKPLNLRFILLLPDNSPDTVERIMPELYYSLTSTIFTLPELKDRPEDIPALFRHVFEGRYHIKALLPDSVRINRILRTYSWPGNLIEMTAAANRLHALIQGNPKPTAHISAQMMLEAIGNETMLNDILKRFCMAEGPGNTVESRARFLKGLKELKYIFGYNNTQLAKLLNISRTTLWRIMQAAGETEGEE